MTISSSSATTRGASDDEIVMTRPAHDSIFAVRAGEKPLPVMTRLSEKFVQKGRESCNLA